MSKRNKTRIKEERIKQAVRRWCLIPKDTYPYENTQDISSQKAAEATEAILDQQQYLPWSVPKEEHPCRPFHPEDLWELGALKKAIYNELEGCLGDGLAPCYSSKGKEKETVGCRTEYCLRHILNCWKENIRTYESAGPCFLIHILKNTYGDDITFANLRGHDQEVVEIVDRAIVKRSFHIFLGKLIRTSLGIREMGSLRVSNTELSLHNIIHAGGYGVNVYPRVAEGDFIDEWYFEGQRADKCNQTSATWERAVCSVGLQ